jgi:hypothetical protein
MDYVYSLKLWEFNALVEDMNREANASTNSRAGHPPGSTPVIT